MRHPSTEDLLLYAEGELEDLEICRHVADCVDCKAQIVDLQETYVYATTDLLAQTAQPVAPPLQLNQFRERLAAEAELLSAHLSTEQLLLAMEDSLDAHASNHLDACGDCRNRAADIHVQLAEIEYELHHQVAYELPAERRAAALAALRSRLRREVRLQTTPAWRRWIWMPSFRLPEIPTFASYATAFAAACLLVLVGWNNLPTTEVPSAPQVAELVVPTAPAEIAPSEAAPPPEPISAPAPARFELAEADLTMPTAPAELAVTPFPALAYTPVAGPMTAMAIDQPQFADLPAPTAVTESQFVVPLPGRITPQGPDSVELAAEGSWLLASTGLWNESLQAGGTGDRIHFTGSAADEAERLWMERKLRAAADGTPVEFSISVRSARALSRPASAPVALATIRPAGGPVRNSLVQHYEDAARRSFQPLAPSTIANELNLYITSVMRDEAELLAHVHALHELLNRADIDEARNNRDLRRVVDFHLDGITRHEEGIHDKLSEALAWNFWNHRSPKSSNEQPEGLGATSRELLRDTLALDRALTGMFFGTSEPLDARSDTPSVGTLLSRVHRHARNVRKQISRR